MILLMTICTALIIGLVVNGFASIIGSTFLCSFLDQNLILLLVATFAINTTTVSVLLTKMREISDNFPDVDFDTTRKEMKTSSIEQMGLIIFSVFVGILKESPRAAALTPHLPFILDSILVGIFTYALFILYDTAKGIYVILDHGH